MNQYEVIITGGSYSGLSAAMALGRAQRNILIVDSGLPCNRHTPHSHNLLMHDGEMPAALSEKSKSQVLQYPTVTFLKGKVISASGTDGNFKVNTEAGETFSADKLFFGTGVYDIMPDIDGFEDCWGISALHCPYCHGYEVKGEKTALFANGDMAWHMAQLLLQWTKDLTVFSDGPSGFTPEQKARLQHFGIDIIEGRIGKLEHHKGYVKQIVLKDGTKHAITAIYARPKLIQHCPVPQEIGCAVNDGGYITVDEMQKTNVPGIFAAGDCTVMMRSVALAIASGSKAGAAINNEMAMEHFAA